MVVVLNVVVDSLKLIERVLLLSLIAVDRVVLVVAVEILLVLVHRRLLVVLRRLDH